MTIIEELRESARTLIKEVTSLDVLTLSGDLKVTMDGEKMTSHRPMPSWRRPHRLAARQAARQLPSRLRWWLSRISTWTRI